MFSQTHQIPLHMHKHNRPLRTVCSVTSCCIGRGSVRGTSFWEKLHWTLDVDEEQLMHSDEADGATRDSSIQQEAAQRWTTRAGEGSRAPGVSSSGCKPSH